MSKAPKNIEKVLLGVAVVVAGGLVYLGMSKSSAVSEDFSSNPGGQHGEDIEIKDAMKVTEVVSSRTSNRVLDVGTIPSDKLEGGQREVNLFTGVPLFASREDPNNPVDLPTSADVHPPIPNVWWLKYNVSPQFADSPQRDDDGDGFSNIEEFNAGTDPSDKNVHPSLVAKLSFVKDESQPWRVEFGFETGGVWIPKLKTGALPEEAGPKNRVAFDKGLKPGDLFFGEDPMKGRFKFTGFEERTERNERLKIDETLKYAQFEDQKPNKLGLKYEVPNRLPRAQFQDFQQFDRTAVLDLQALGLDGKEFKVEERTNFALPPTAKEKDYYLKEVTPEAIVVEWKDKDGQTHSVSIPKGGLPDMK
ncbi:Amuc_1099 family pilus-like system protein [Haloferula chungangensis]|uniref:Amuc_1099 family pilus-like system protein n=1 Tax=Haloferula chungangensis TaxID=1048331 RepID=A0ABW2L4K7_9BACT